MTEASLSRKLRGLADWSLHDLESLANALRVSVSELVGTIPPASEWDRRRTPSATPAHPGPRFLVQPEPTFDYRRKSLAPMSLIGDHI
jgi:hypothetical protein